MEDKVNMKRSIVPSYFGWQQLAKHLSAIALVISTIGLFASAAVFAEPQQLDKVVAIVDQDVILASELDERLSQVMTRASATQMGLPDEGVLRKQVLDHLITERLQLQVANRYNLQISDEEINLSFVTLPY